MCGIFAYVGEKECAELLKMGLERLEYRGYDSAGIATIEHEELHIKKSHGRVNNLIKYLEQLPGTIGIAHTRWATHGIPSHINAHPHLSHSKKLVLVHNGIIENHAALRLLLEKEDFVFVSETDTEVLAHLIEFELESLLKKKADQEVIGASCEDVALALRNALKHVHGAFGLVFMHLDCPDTLFVARRGSPLVIGLAKNETFVASDPSALVEHTKEVIYLEDNQCAVLSKHSHKILTIQDGKSCSVASEHIDWDVEQLEKQGYDYFMLKEIFEQPSALNQTIAGRMKMLRTKGELPNLNINKDFSKNLRRIIILACGTSWHAGLVAKNYFESLTSIPVEVAYASEFRYAKTPISKNDLVIVISQSGETADTLEALKHAKKAGAKSVGVVNVVGSSIAREVDGGLYLHAGPEIGVASTKAFTTQILALLFIALHITLQRNELSTKDFKEINDAIEEIPRLAEKALKSYDTIKQFAKEFIDAPNALYLGRFMHYPVALEGALKLKEISYIHAEGLPAAEMKHGPIALIDQDMPIVVLAPSDALLPKVISNIEEVKARGGRTIIVASSDGKTDAHLNKLADYLITIPRTHEFLQPLLSVIPLQLLAYELAVLRECDVDKPRNLAKSVTVE